MPIIKSAKKRVRQAARQHTQNLVTKRALRDTSKAFLAAIAAADKKAADTALKGAQSALDTAVKKNLIHRNKAARRLSQLSKAAKALGVKPSAAEKKPVAKKTTAKPAAKKTVAKKPAAKKTPAKK
jgi:ribosomal protein S20